MTKQISLRNRKIITEFHRLRETMKAKDALDKLSDMNWGSEKEKYFMSTENIRRIVYNKSLRKIVCLIVLLLIGCAEQKPIPESAKLAILRDSLTQATEMLDYCQKSLLRYMDDCEKLSENKLREIRNENDSLKKFLKKGLPEATKKYIGMLERK